MPKFMVGIPVIIILQIATTCVSESTIDESPMAYKSMEQIVGQIAPTAEIVMRVKSVYNFKAGEYFVG